MAGIVLAESLPRHVNAKCPAFNAGALRRLRLVTAGSPRVRSVVLSPGLLPCWRPDTDVRSVGGDVRSRHGGVWRHGDGDSLGPSRGLARLETRARRPGSSWPGRAMTCPAQTASRPSPPSRAAAPPNAGRRSPVHREPDRAGRRPAIGGITSANAFSPALGPRQHKPAIRCKPPRSIVRHSLVTRSSGNPGRELMTASPWERERQPRCSARHPVRGSGCPSMSSRRQRTVHPPGPSGAVTIRIPRRGMPSCSR